MRVAAGGRAFRRGASWTPPGIAKTMFENPSFGFRLLRLKGFFVCTIPTYLKPAAFLLAGFSFFSRLKPFRQFQKNAI